MTLLLLAVAILAVILIQRQNNRLTLLEQELKALRTRFETGERFEAAGQVPATVASEGVAEPEPRAVPVPPPEPSPPAADVPPGEPANPAEFDTPVPARPAWPQDLAASLGSRWAVWVGGLALALGGLFLVRYSLEAGWIGPRVRLALAAALGLVLLVAAETARRRGFAAPLPIRGAPSIPAVLASAATFVLFGTVYAAHGIYGFLGSATAFALLGVLGIGAILAAPRYGRAVAALGLLGSYLTPALVASQSAAAWTLFAYLAVVLLASMAVASRARWAGLAAGALIGSGLWSLAYLFFSADAAEPLPVVSLQLASLVAIAALWLAPRRDPAPEARDTHAVCALAGIFAATVAAILVRALPDAPLALPLAALLLAAMVLAAALRRPALPLLHLAGAATVLLSIWDTVAQTTLLPGAGTVLFQVPGSAIAQHRVFDGHGAGLSLLVLALGLALGVRDVRRHAASAFAWASWAALVPLSALGASWFLLGDTRVDLAYGAAALVLALVLAGGAEAAGRREEPPQRGGRVVSALATGAAAALALSCPMLFEPLATLIATSFGALLVALVTRRRRWPALGWLAVAFVLATLARVAWDPTVVGRAALATTPFLNALLPAYALPALFFALAAWVLSRTTAGRPWLALQAASALFALIGAGMLVRHAMNGGVIGAGEPQLAEQAIYTLILTGGGVILTLIDRRAPSPVWRWGSLVLGTLSVLSVAAAHLVLLNPLFTDEPLGASPVFDLLLLAYALPALAFGAAAWVARGRRSPRFVALLTAVAALMALGYATLRLRRVFHGERIGLFWGTGNWETYSLSALWLLIGVALLVAGVRWGSRPLRTASAALVVLAVAKVFLFDMRHLEGVLRPLSFIGLGAVLIAIGLFYQRMLRRGAAGTPVPVAAGAGE